MSLQGIAILQSFCEFTDLAVWAPSGATTRYFRDVART